MAKKSAPDPIDLHVGGRVRLRRMLVGLSQEKLGENLGLTFQQVQKYEKGANRIGASRLYQIACVLGVPVQFFYEGLALAPQASAGFADAGVGGFDHEDRSTSPEGLQLMAAFYAIRDAKVRRKIQDLVRALGESQQVSQENEEPGPEVSD